MTKQYKKTQLAKFRPFLLAFFFCFSSFITHSLANASTSQAQTFRHIPFEASYIALRHGSKIGSAQMTLSEVDSTKLELFYSSDISRFFFSDKRSELTQYQLNNNGSLTPLFYQYNRKGTGPDKQLNLDFNVDENKVVVDNGKSIISGTNKLIDNQLFRIDISKQLAAGKQLFEYDFVNYRGEKRHYKIEVLGTEFLSLPYKQLDSIKVMVKRESKKRVTYAWFAPSLNFNLVRLQQFKENKEQGDIQLKAFVLTE